MNPYRLKNVFEYLTSNNQLLKKKLKLGTSEVPIPPKRKDVIDIEAINRFNKANPRVDTTSLKPLSVKHSNVRQSNVNEPNEGAIQSAFDTATRDAQFEGYPAPSYEKFKSRYLKKNMKADGGRAGYEDGGMLVQPSNDGSRPGYNGKKKINRDESYRTVVKDFTATSGPGTGKIFDDPAAIEIVKANLNKIKKQRNNKNLFEWSENSDWYKKLRKELNPNTKTGTNREFTNKLINKVVDEFFPGSYHGKTAIKNFRNDMVVKSFIQHLKSVGEFDGQEKFDKVLEQFKNPPKKGTPNNYESINKSWNDWRTGKFEVEGVDRAELKKELKARGIDYNKTIGKWTASGAQLRGKNKIKELTTLNNFNRFTNKSAEEIRALFLKKHPDANFDLRVNELTQLKRNGVYVSGANTELPVTGIEKGDRAGWLKKAYGKQFAGNYSKIINAADKLAAAGETSKAERLYKAADKFFGPTGIIRKSAVGEAEHALARSFDFLNPDRQLAINSIVSGDLNQFKKNLFDIPVKNYFDEYNKPETTKARRVELKNFIEERKKVMNALTGGQKSGIVAGDIVNFRYGANEITATSSVKPIDSLFKEGKFNIDDYIERGNKYTEAFETATKDIDLKKNFSTPIYNEKQLSISLELLKASNPESAKKVNILLGSGFPVNQIAEELVKIPGVRQFRKAFTALGGPIGAAIEAAFALSTYNNEISKGTPHATALEIAQRDASFGLAGEVDQARMTDLTNAGSEIGVNTTGFQELKTILDLEKSIEKEKSLLTQMSSITQDIGSGGDGPGLSGEFDIEQQQNKIADLESQYQLQATKLRSSENFDTLFEDYNSAVEYLARKQYNKVVDIKKNQVDPNSGTMGSDFMATIMSPIKSLLPQNLMETGLNVPTSLIPGINKDIDFSIATRPYVRAAQKIPFIGDFFKPTSDAAKLSAMSQEEKDQRALDMNIVKQNYHPVMGTTMRPDQMEEYYANYFSKGGIASLTDTIPPESGPTPQGLPYVYNNVKKI